MVLFIRFPPVVVSHTIIITNSTMLSIQRINAPVIVTDTSPMVYSCSSLYSNCDAVSLIEIGKVVFSRNVRVNVPLTARHCSIWISLEKFVFMVRGLSPLGHRACWQL